MTFVLNDRSTGETKYQATRCDLIFGSNAQLRSVCEVYAGSDGHGRFVKDFVKVWNKVMMLDRFDIKTSPAFAPYRNGTQAGLMQTAAR